MSANRRAISSFLYAPFVRVEAEKSTIHGVAVVTEGEALGHGIHLDADFIKAAVEKGNAQPNGIKARFGHPTMSSTALGTFLGRFKNFRGETSDGRAVARADLHLSNAAKDAPGGDLHSYVLKLAQSDPKAFGSSIVFDIGEHFVLRDGQKVTLEDGVEPEKGEKIYVTLADLFAADLVDDPAAAPDGLFQSQFANQTWAGQVSEFLDAHPKIFELLDKNPDVVSGFVKRYRAYRARRSGTVTGKELIMTDQHRFDAEIQDLEAAAEPAEDEVVDDTPAESGTESAATTQTETAAEGKPVAAEPAPAAPAEPPAQVEAGASQPTAEELRKVEGQKFLAAFGQKGGVWFAEGLSFEAARTRHEAELKAENETLKAQVKTLEAKIAAQAAPKGDGVAPLSLNPPAEAAGPQAQAEEYLAKAKAYKQEHGGSMREAYSQVGRAHPELLAAYKSRRA